MRLSREGQFLFPPFRFDPVNECLWEEERAGGNTTSGFATTFGGGRSARQIPLTHKACSLLHHLILHAGKLITKEELLEAVWPETHVGDGVLKVAIAEIRKALRDSPDAPRFIETAHRRGYRFVATLQRSDRRRDASNVAVGRQSVMLTLQSLLARASSGERQIVFVTGEAGIGKTTVVESLLATIAAED